MAYFTLEQFDTLNTYAKTKKHDDDESHTHAVAVLKEAYELTEQWANSVKAAYFPTGSVKLRKSPINQAGNFAEYTWAKIYPTPDVPKELAFTVGLYTEGFTVKIDTVNVDTKIRKQYEEIRGDSHSSIVSELTIDEGLAMTMEELVNWSVEQIGNFSPSYDVIATQMGILTSQTSNSVGIVGATQSADTTLLPQSNKPSPLNQIFYGPPGTGKTYQTIEAAVIAAEPDYLLTTRAALKIKYDELVDEKRIRFVTFHQSYGYEEFVEGLRANAVHGQVSYDVEPGIFRQMCDQASQGVEPDSDPLEQALEQFKAELEESPVLNLKTLRGNDFGVQYHGNTTFRVFPEATSHDDLVRGYPVSIDNIRKLYRGASTKKLYNSSYVKAILSYIKKNYRVAEYKAPALGQAKNFVLIIDEINRGNISKIFGELITLIEDSKRSGDGQDESIEVILPNSGDPFSVPNNLYLIGTMNTADRSLAMMDTALRRRFDFVEMMPKPALLKDAVLKSIDLEALLNAINQRIEALYDREHTLGHAFFIPISKLVDDQDQAFDQLQLVFKNKIIPLLEEYFFDDWNKIRLVLGDNQKPERLQFVREEKQSFDHLFGQDHGLNNYEHDERRYSLSTFGSAVWSQPEAYIGIYKQVEANA